MKGINNDTVSCQSNIAALYLRLSKEDMHKNAKEDSESIKNQRLLLIEEALKRGFVVADIYCDEDYSGTDSRRPEFNRLVKDAKQKKFNVIICKSQSRFTRDMQIAEKYINGIFPLLGIRFISIVDHIDTGVMKNKRAQQINALINEWYVEDLSENIKSVYKSKMRQGQFLGAFAAYGYKKKENDRHKLVIDEEAAQVVRKIFQYYIAGYSIQNICYKLQEENILTPSVYKQSKGFNFQSPNSKKYSQGHLLWGQSTVKRILTNQIYIGTLIQGREKKLSYKSNKTVLAPKEEWVVIKDNHDPIISKEDFYKVQEILKLRRKFSKISDKKHKVYPLAGKVKCKDCGCTMVRSGKKGTNTNYLRCRLASKSASKQCTNHSIKYNVLEKKVLEALQSHIRDILSNEEDFKSIENDIILKQKPPFVPIKTKLKNIYMEKEKLNTSLKKCDIDQYSADLDENLFLKLKNNDSNNMKTITNTIEILENKFKNSAFDSSYQNKEREIIKKYGAFTELTNEVVYDFIDFIEIGEKNESGEQDIIVHWKF